MMPCSSLILDDEPAVYGTDCLDDRVTVKIVWAMRKQLSSTLGTALLHALGLPPRPVALE